MPVISAETVKTHTGNVYGEIGVSNRTVETHIANILSKLGFINHPQTMRWAKEAGLGSQRRLRNECDESSTGDD